MADLVIIPGRRSLEADLDRAEDPAGLIVACPPHPSFGGSRTDRRLRAVSDGLVEAGIDCLRFDYGPWDGGPGERDDTVDAIAWGAEYYDRIGVFGYSFGGSMAILGGATTGVPLVGVSALAPSVRLARESDLHVVSAFESLPCDVQVIYGERDQTVEWRPIIDVAKDRGCELVAMSADHFFVGQGEAIANAVVAFFEKTIGISPR